MSKFQKWVVLPDIHAPLHNEEALKPVLAFIKDYKPDGLIQLGDLCDFNSLSRFDKNREEELVSLHAEIEAANSILDRIDSVCPKRIVRVLLEGNHDARPTRFRLNRWNSQVQDILGMPRLGDFHELFHLRKRGWDWRNYGQCFPVGKALFTHGWFVGSYHASKTLKRWFKSIYYGHTHTYQSHTVLGMDGLPVSAVSLGTLSRFDLSYLHGVPPADWINMFAHFEFFGSGQFTPHPVPIINGRFVTNGKYYSA